MNASDKLKSLGHANPMDAIEIVESVAFSSLIHDPEEWGQTFAKIKDTAFESNYLNILGAVWMLTMMACFPTWLSDWIIEWLNVNFYEKYNNKATADWIRNDFKPQADSVINTFTIPIYYRPILMIKLGGVLFKGFFGLAWQEDVFPLLKSVYGNKVATKFLLSLTPMINWVGSRIDGYAQTDEA